MADVAAVERMTTGLAPRGPDGCGAWASGHVALGHRRLSIIDLSDRGAQPLVDSELGVVVAFNGCIYNYEALRDELTAAGHRFFSSSDSEVITKAYRAWGDRCVERFQGMFAFALYDRDARRLVLARDRLGIKPLYVAETAGALRFASTLPALVAGGGLDTSLEPDALHHYFSWHAVVPAPLTLLRGVRKLEPATVLTVEADGTRERSTYWEPEFTRRSAYEGWEEQDWADAVLGALKVAVARRMVADVRVGVLLSGGLDSSLIVALLDEAGQRDLATYSIGFESEGEHEGDEFEYSDAIAQEFGTEHQRWTITATQIVDALDGTLDAMSEPMGSHDNVAFYLLAEQVSQSIKVVQTGQGADEVFGGYSWYPPMVEASGLGDEAYAEAFIDRSHEEMGRLLGDGFLADRDVSREFVTSHFARPGADEPLDRALRLDTTIMLIDDPVKRLDNMTMAWGLEARTPFLDHELVELAAACPPELKIAQDGKGVLKTAARSLVPDAVIDRPKGYFPVPALSHLQGPTLDLVRETLTSARARDRGLFRPAYVEQLLADPDGQRTPLDSSKLWQIGLLELWLQRHEL